MIEWHFGPVICAAGLVAFSLAHRRILRGAQPIRLELVDKCRMVLSHKAASAKTKQDVNFILNGLFSMRGTLLLGIFVIPVLGFVIIFNQDYFTKLRHERRSMNPRIRALMGEIRDLHESVTLANHPILMTIVQFEMFLTIHVCVIVRSLVSGLVPRHQDRSLVLGVLEAKYKSMLVPAMLHVSGQAN